MEVKEKKEYSRSIRMTPTVQAYVEKQKGEGFNEKFENMVLWCKCKEKELNDIIKQKEKMITQLDKDIQEKKSLLADLNKIGYNIEEVKKGMERIFSQVEIKK